MSKEESLRRISSHGLSGRRASCPNNNRRGRSALSRSSLAVLARVALVARRVQKLLVRHPAEFAVLIRVRAAFKHNAWAKRGRGGQRGPSDRLKGRVEKSAHLPAIIQYANAIVRLKLVELRAA